MEIKLTLDNIVKALAKHRFEPVLQKETNQIYIPLKVKNLDVPLFVGLSGENKLLQLVAYLPYHLHEKTIGEVARLLHMLNRDMDMPGFGMDERSKLIFYRLMVPAFEEKIDEKLLSLYVGTMKLACETFVHVIGLITSGNLKVDEFMAQNG